MGVVNFGINKGLVAEMVKSYDVPNFVETGTYLGDTSHWASGLFKEVHTVEISESLYEKAKARFGNVNNMHFYLGDSKKLVPEIVSNIEGPALYWLDGHWCGRNTGGKFNECPIMDELEHATRNQGSILLIDDYRYFLGPNPYDYGENYPTLQSIVKFIHERLPNHYLTFHDDTIICVPNELKEIVDKDWREHYSKRFPATFKSMFSKIVWRIKNLDFTPESKREN